MSRRVLRSLENLNHVKDKAELNASHASISEAISTTNLDEVPELEKHNLEEQAAAVSVVIGRLLRLKIVRRPRNHSWF